MRHQVAVAHQQQVTAVVGFVHHVAGDQQRGPAAGEIGELLPEVCPQHGVQPHCRFVENQQLGLADQRARQRHPGALTTGEIAAIGGAVIGQPHPIDRGVGGAAVESVKRRKVADVVDDPQIVVDRRVLRQVSDAAAQRSLTRPVDRAPGPCPKRSAGCRQCNASAWSSRSPTDRAAR